MTRILASATVDPDGFCRWTVTVTGRPPHDETRVYSLSEPTDNLAAQEGIRRFVEEMERLSS